jgi:hypothetical protein
MILIVETCDKTISLGTGITEKCVKGPYATLSLKFKGAAVLPLRNTCEYRFDDLKHKS